MKYLLSFIILTIVFISTTSQISPAANPEELYKWKEFLVYGEDKFHCVPEFNDDNKFHCKWPGILKLEIYENKILFSQKINLFTDSYIKLPGNLEIFPVNVQKNNKPIPVSVKNKFPVCFPGKGEFEISGELPFDEIPDFINLPEFSGGYKLDLKTDKISSPYTDLKNILWLKKTLSEKDNEKEHLRVNVFRKIKDSFPCEIESVYKINVSGSSRQEKISTGNIPGQITFVKSPLPLKIGKNGCFYVQVKPGEYEISIKNILPQLPLELGPFNSGYNQEIIALEKEPGVRISNIKNLKTIDPKNTDIPDLWKNLLTFILSPEKKILFEETIRGVLPSQPDLKLEREIWIDFNGKGSTIKDQIKGKLHQRTFIGILDKSEIIPGKISINNQDKIITKKGNLSGICVNEGSFSMESVSRKNNSKNIFPPGWELDFSNISGYINIPPGYEILSVSGAKLSGNHSFISKWTLLDIFVLCILFISAYKIWNIKWGILFFICAGAVYHKFYVPPYIWILLVIFSGILNSNSLKTFFFQKQFFKVSFNLIYFSCLLTVFSAAIVFSAQNIKYFVYPSLDTHLPSYKTYPPEIIQQKQLTPTDNFMRKSSANLKQRLDTRTMAIDREIEKPVYQLINDQEFTQTGVGLPLWKNKKIRFENAWDNQMKIYLIPPIGVRAIYLSNIFFLFILLFKLIPFKNIFSKLKPLSKTNTALVFVLGLSLSLVLPEKGFSSQYPPEYLLKEYKQRLLNTKNFEHQLAIIKNCSLNASKSGDKIRLEMIFNIDSTKDCAVYLPQTKDLEYENLYLNSKEQHYILNNKGKTLSFIPKGIHELKVFSVSKKDEIELKFDMVPLKLSFNSEGVSSKGIENRGFSPLIKIFIPKNENEKNTLKGIEGALPFPVVERSLFLGREWKIKTKIKRFYPQNNDKKAEVSINLIENEKILKKTGEIKNNKLEITLLPKVNSWEFESEIPVGQNIEIISEKEMTHLEEWRIDSDSLRDFEVKGLLPVKYNYNNNTVFVLQPGTKGFILPEKLKPIKGRFFTIDKTELIYDLRQTKNTLKINSSIRAGKGFNHKITYDNSKIYPEELIINNIKNQIPELNGELILPLSPGTNEVNIIFKEKNKNQSFFLPQKTNFPEINLNSESTNINQEIKYPSKSWIIGTYGPKKGPAVLFWGYFAGVILVAIFLTKLGKSFLKPHQFILLAAGLSISALLEIIIVFGFFLAIEYRKNLIPAETKFFNLIQTGLVFLLVISAIIIYNAVSSGLLGIPEMQVTGNGSYSGNLKWFSDKADNFIPSVFIILAPINLWRLVLFLWSIWISAFLINKTPYIIDSLKHEGFWKKTKFIRKKNKE
ncbi:MAG: hypothetical protein RBR53_04990 [Desulforegulaceae bacterium]|nr:hypothetical protein [Desulforegulaceae bacterium]